MRLVNRKWTYEEKEDHIILRWRNFEVLIDPEDFHYFDENILRIIYNKRKFSKEQAYLYIQDGIYPKYKYETFHRIILNAPSDKFVDHINGNTLDNRKLNLRFATHSENLGNSKKMIRFGKASSIYKGVTKLQRKLQWRCVIVKDKIRHESFHHTEIEAAEKYNELAVKLFGEFARLNVIKK